MIGRIDQYVRWLLSWPFVLIGLALSFVSAWLIRVGAWIADVDLDEEDTWEDQE